MKFIPKYTVSYKGVFRRAGEAFEIDAKDMQEMEKHGAVEQKTEPVRSNEEIIASVETGIEQAAQPVRKGGRPRKVSA